MIEIAVFILVVIIYPICFLSTQNSICKGIEEIVEELRRMNEEKVDVALAAEEEGVEE